MNHNSSTYRIMAFFVIGASLIWGYWWLTWVLAIAFLFIFPLYYEIIFAGIVYDAIYGLPLPQFYDFPYMFTVAGIILFILAFFLRKKLAAYDPL